jgi:streptomycin 6-kinase
MEFPEGLQRRVVGVYGERGAEWWEALPGLVEEFAERWRLVLGQPYEVCSLSYVVRAVRADGARVVLKLSVPEPWVADEAAALSFFGGRGAVRLEAVEAARGALLLERAEPGDHLARLCERDDRAATIVAAGVMRELCRTAPDGHALPRLAKWLEWLGGGDSESVPRALRAACGEARAVVRELSADDAEEVLLHGDLHHFNIVAATREPWLAVDPKGLVGPREAEAAALLRNPRSFLLARADRVSVVARRIRLLAEELSAEAEVLRGWGYALAVLAAWWGFEEGEEAEWSAWLECAATIKSARD